MNKGTSEFFLIHYSLTQYYVLHKSDQDGKVLFAPIFDFYQLLFDM